MVALRDKKGRLKIPEHSKSGWPHTGEMIGAACRIGLVGPNRMNVFAGFFKAMRHGSIQIAKLQRN